MNESQLLEYTQTNNITGEGLKSPIDCSLELEALKLHRQRLQNEFDIKNKEIDNKHSLDLKKLENERHAKDKELELEKQKLENERHAKDKELEVKKKENTYKFIGMLLTRVLIFPMFLEKINFGNTLGSGLFAYILSFFAKFFKK